MTRPRKILRAEALKDVLGSIRSLRCPPGKDAIWEREFSDALGAIARMLENQIAQAEGRVIFRRGKLPSPPPPPRRSSNSSGGGSEN